MWRFSALGVMIVGYVSTKDTHRVGKHQSRYHQWRSSWGPGELRQTPCGCMRLIGLLWAPRWWWHSQIGQDYHFLYSFQFCFHFKPSPTALLFTSLRECQTFTNSFVSLQWKSHSQRMMNIWQIWNDLAFASPESLTKKVGTVRVEFGQISFSHIKF